MERVAAPGVRRRRGRWWPGAMVVLAGLLAGLLVLSSALPAGAQAPAPSAAPPPRVAERVLLVGDSAMRDAQSSLAAVYEAAGATRVERQGLPGFGLTRTATPRGTPPWRTDWPRLVADVRPDLTVVMLGGWDVTWIDTHGVDAYRRQVEDATRVLSARGGRVVWLSVLPGGTQPTLRMVDDVLAQAAAELPDQAAYVNITWPFIGPQGGFPQTITTATGSVLRLRKLDGWHLCQDGAVRLARYVDRATTRLGLSTLAPVGWEKGPWWDDEAFDSEACWPPGAWRS